MSEEIPFKLILSRRAKDELKRLDKPIAERIVKKLLWMAEMAETTGHGMLGLEYDDEGSGVIQSWVTMTGSNGGFTLTSAPNILDRDAGTVQFQFPSSVNVATVGTPLEIGEPESLAPNTGVAFATLADTSTCSNPHDCVHVEHGRILEPADSSEGVPGIIYSDPTSSSIRGSSGGGVYALDSDGGLALIANNWIRQPNDLKLSVFGALVR